MTRQSWLGALAAVILAALLIFYARSISEFLVGLFFKTNPNVESASTPSTGQITAHTGSVWIREPGHRQFTKSSSPQKLYHLSQIKVDKLSSAHLSLESGWVIALHENSLATIELYRPDTTTSPALLSFIRGEYQVLTKGPPGHLFIMKNKKVFSPEAPPPSKIRKVELSPQTLSSSPTSSLTSTPSLINELPGHPPIDNTPLTGITTTLPSATKPGPMPDKIKHQGEETLTGSYIEQVLSSHAQELRRCQLNSVRGGQSAEGSLLLSFTITPQGRVEHIKVLQDQIKNERLTSCTTSVLERAQFKSFTGLPITLTYPLQFR